MPREVLQYDSLRTVLQYIEANKRLHLSQFIPSIRFAEKVVPLKIDNLQFNELGVNINSTTYQLSLYRDFHQGEEVVDPFQKENDMGGVQNDLDQFGFLVPINRTDVVPGEIVFGDVVHQNRNFTPNLQPSFPCSHQQNDERMRRYYEKHLEIYQIALMRRLEQGDPEREETPARSFHPLLVRLFTDDELLATAGPVRQELTEEELEGKLAVLTRVPTWYLEKIITLLRYCLQPFDCLHNNRAIPFTTLIQLTIKSKDQVERIERYPYTVKLHEAMRKLNRMMFGGRSSIVNVYTFSFRLRNVVLRIPEGLKIRVRDLWLDENMNGRLEALGNIIDESSYPLEVLTIFNAEEEEADPFSHPILTSARNLILEGFKPTDMTRLLNLRNEKVFFEYCTRARSLTVENLLSFVRNVLAARSPVGVYRSFRVQDEALGRNFLNQVAEQFNGIRRFRTARIPMGNDSILEMFYNDTLSNVLEDRPPITKWTVVMTVVAA
ncbi:hypothetical protein GCK72_007307 [Caenorhabditis remanei]|uniref:Uncharacterized protein n=1 Tax=Caenorhabditis remanei TaxID=31234 RepID=A0A6A5HHM7_CAERE|nr:hypothetical protein GCK72_007307 [Caenorhabditis remanei]KAF1767348.1 hypothetical protein GCK72_007307 [Caenorhabditis remanei]